MKKRKPQNQYKMSKLETNRHPGDITDEHSGKRKFIRGGRKKETNLQRFEDRKTQNWDRMVNDWLEQRARGPND